MWKRYAKFSLIGALVLVPAAALAAGGAAQMWRMHHAPPATEAEMKDHIAMVAGHVLERIGASDDQKQKIDAILDGAADDLWSHHEDRAALHDAFQAAFTGEKVDRKALEQARKDLVDHVDAATRDLVDVFADVGDVLTQDQRKQVAQIHDEIMSGDLAGE